MDHTEEISLYLREEMPSFERAEFERRLAEDTELAKEFVLQERIYRTLQDKDGLAFYQKLQTILKQTTKRPFRKPVLWKRWFALLLSVLLTGGFAYWLFLPNKTSPTLPPVSPVQGRPQPLQSVSPPVVIKGEKNATKAPPANPNKGSVSSEKVLALVEHEYNENLFSKVDRGLLRSNVKVYNKTDSIGIAFDQGDYPLVLQIAESYPENDPYYNSVIWTAANAAFLQNDCTRAAAYAGKISKIKDNEAKAEDAELLLLLNYIKCGLMGDPACQTLIKKCARNSFHPAYELARAIKKM